MALEINDTLFRVLSPNELALDDARGLLDRGAFRGRCLSYDGCFVMADCHGSGKSPYRVAIDLGAGERPLAWCTCPSRANPCKHALGLMLGYARAPEDFARVEAPQELLDRRAKLLARPSRIEGLKGEALGETKSRTTSVLSAQRKSDEQRGALETLERFLVDLVSQGLGGAHARTFTAIDAQASRMGDSDLTGLRGLLLRLSAALRAEGSGTDQDEEGGHPGGAVEFFAAMPPEARNALAIGYLTQLWVTVKKARAALEGGASTEGALELLLGRKWQLPQLKEAGHWVENRRLMELAHERVDDVVSENVLTTGWLLDLDDGAVRMERTIIPYRALHAAEVKHRSPREGVLSVREAALYPGDGMNRRVRWADRDPWVCVERAATPEDYAVLHALALPVAWVMKKWREVLKSPTAERECVVLLDARGFESRGGRLLMFDGAGHRVMFEDPPMGGSRTTPTLRHAAGAQRAGSVAARLWLDPVTHTARAQALALIAGERHLRLGM